MVGWLRRTGVGYWRPTLTPVQILGYPLVEVSLPPGDRWRRLAQGARLLTRHGIQSVVTAPGLASRGDLETLGLAPVDPLPLCLAKAGDMVRFLLREVPPRRRRVALRGDQVDRPAWRLAHALCQETGGLLLDFDRGGEELARSLRTGYGAAPLPFGEAEPQVTVEFSPRGSQGDGVLRLWGRPDLAGLTFRLPEALPPDLEGLPFLALLWEAGRIRKEDIPVTFALDRPEESTYNMSTEQVTGLETRQNSGKSRFSIRSTKMKGDQTTWRSSSN